MVFFTCNACGTSLKKNQVEKHYQNECRNCEVLSCIDCGKDFYGEDYASHTKCISEAEKYQGALFKELSGGGGTTKGEKKQQEWLERVRQSTASAKVSSRIASLLERISEYPNVPRKRKKFENFVRNSINVRDQGTLSQLWDAFNDATSVPETQQLMNGSQKNSDDNDPQEQDKTETEKDDSQVKKKKKKKHKKHSVEENETIMESKKQIDCDGTVEPVAEVIAMEFPKKKRKKDKHRACEDELEYHSTSGKKKRKHSHTDKEENELRTKKAKTVC